MGISKIIPCLSRGEKATAGNWKSNFTAGAGFRLTIRFLQFVVGIAIIGLYGQDLDRAHRQGVAYDPKWMYVTITAVLSCFWALACMSPWIKAWALSFIDFILFILYVAALGIFGKMYMHEDPEGNKGIIRMKNSVWVLLTNMCLWFISTCYGAVIFYMFRKARTAHTGRAPAHV